MGEVSWWRRATNIVQLSCLGDQAAKDQGIAGKCPGDADGVGDHIGGDFRKRR